MNLAKELTKFSIFFPIVLALNLKDVSAQDNVESLGQMAQSYNLRDTYREQVILKNLKQGVSLGTGLFLSNPQDSYLRSNFPIQYGAEINGNVKINKNWKTTAFVNFSKGNSNTEQERKISSSSIGGGIEYSTFADFGVGIVNKTQNISGPKNGFPGHLNKTGFYIQAKKEIPIIPEELSLYFKVKCSNIKEIGSNEISAGLIFKP